MFFMTFLVFLLVFILIPLLILNVIFNFLIFFKHEDLWLFWTAILQLYQKVYKKYTIPISIFVVYENINPIIWTSNSFGYNNYIIYINQSWFYSLNCFLKNELFFSNSSLLESSAVDNKNNFDFLKKNQIFLKQKTLLFFVYYFFYSLSCFRCWWVISMSFK